MRDLEEKIAELKSKDAWDKELAALFPTIKHSAFLMGWNDKYEKHANMKAKDFKEVNQILSILPPSEKKTVISSAGKDAMHTLQTPFRFDINNPAQPSTSYPYCVNLGYMSGKIDVDIEIPIELLKDFTTNGQRKITDCEYHYFTGWSHERLRNHQLKTYEWNSNQMGWFGGNKTLLNLVTIGEIINFIQKEND